MPIDLTTDVASKETFKQNHINLYMSVGFPEERAIAIVDAAMKASDDIVAILNTLGDSFELAPESNNAIGLAASLTAFRIEVLRQDLLISQQECGCDNEGNTIN